MQLSDKQKEMLKQYEEDYVPVFAEHLIGERFLIGVPPSVSPRRCRFCTLNLRKIHFSHEAHAVPEFLGNNRLISTDECNECNDFLNREYENHLANWFGPLRTVSQMKGKNGVPTYKDKEHDGDVRIEMGSNCLEISVKAQDLEKSIKKDGPFTLSLPASTPNKPYIPIAAAKALVKMAYSIAPATMLAELTTTREWIMGHKDFRFSNFPVLTAFTPGVNPYRTGMAMLLRRKTSKPIPSLWCIVATYNYRFQFMVPFSSEDGWLKEGQPREFTATHFPVPFEGRLAEETEFRVLNWSSDQPRTDDVSFGLHVESIREIPLS